MVPALLGERSLECAPARVFQEHAEGVAQVACAAVGRQFDRPVAGAVPRAGKPGAEPCRGRASRARSRAAQSAARSPKPASPRVPSRDSCAAARSADVSSAATASPCCRIYPATVSRVLTAPIAEAAVSTEASGLPRSLSFLSR
jgi:hypothetical protein